MDNQSLAIRESIPTVSGEEIERHLQIGDLSKMSDSDRARYYLSVCSSVGINPLTRPLTLMKNRAGELFLYASKLCCEQLRKRDHVSIHILSRERDGDFYTVVARARTPDGREEESIGITAIKGLQGQALANAFMACETRAKNRVTMAICGLGFFTEEDAAPGSVPIRFDATTGEVVESAPALPPHALPVLLARQTPIGEAIDELLAQGGVTHPDDQERQWQKWLSHYRDFTPAVLGLLRDKLQTRLRDKATATMTIDAELFEDVEEALPMGGAS